MIAGVVVLHIWALHVPGSNNPTGIEKHSDKDTLPFHPYFTVKDGFELVVFLIVLAWFVFYIPNYLGDADNYIQANPLQTPAEIVPEWYYLPYYAILRSIPSKLTGVIALFSAILIFAFLPWLDRSPVKSASYRPLYRIFFWLFIAVVLGLGYVGANRPEGNFVIAGRILTIAYFAFFLVVLPLLPFIEKTRPLPASIADAVLGKTAQPSLKT